MRTNTKKRNSVQIAKIEADNREDVFNMEVADNHNFSVNGGLIVHNCMDALRYFCKTMGVAKPKTAHLSW